MTEEDIEKAFSEAFPPRFDKDCNKEVEPWDAPYQKRWAEIGFRAGLKCREKNDQG